MTTDANITTWSGRTQEETNRENISISDFNAINTDCSTALIQANSANNGSYYKVPPGTWVAKLNQTNITNLLKCMKYLKLDGKLEISIPEGVFTTDETCTINVINGHNLNLIGVTPPTTTILEQIAVSGSSGNYSVTLAVSNASQINIGNFLHTTDTVGTDCCEIHRGGWEVTAVDRDNNQVTVKNTCWLDTFPVNTITSSTTFIIKSVLKFNNVDAFLVFNSQAFFDNIAIIGNSDDYWSSSNVGGTEKGTHGFLIGAASIRLNGRTDYINPYGKSIAHVSCGKKVVISGFDQQGVVTELGASFYGDFVSACNNKRRGFYASTASGIRAKHISANGNYLDGVIADLGGQIYASSGSCACGNGWSGLAATQNGTILYDTGFVKANKNIGGRAYENGTLQIQQANIQYNLNAGIDAQYGSVVYLNSSKISNHPIGVYAQHNSTIRAPSIELKDNALHVRTNTGGFVNLNGANYIGGTNNFKLENESSIEDIQGQIGGNPSYQRLILKDLNTRKNAMLLCTSTGDDVIFSFDSGTGLSEAFHVRDGGTIYPSTTSQAECGKSANKWKNVYSDRFSHTSTVFDAYGVGSPEGVLSASVGSMYRRTDGGVGTTLYVKESGTGNTGWVAK